jgi:hypothetical protein
MIMLDLPVAKRQKKRLVDGYNKFYSNLGVFRKGFRKEELYKSEWIVFEITKGAIVITAT